MIRNLKALGLALVAVFAMSAIAATAASAQNGTLTSDGPVKLVGKNTAGGINKLTALGISVECPNAHYTGFKYEQTPHVFIPNDVSTFTVTAEYGKCKTSLDGDATVDMNGCDYNFHLTGTSGVDEYTLSTTVKCPPNAHIVVTAWFTTGGDNGSAAPCKMTILQKATDYEGLRAVDNTNGTGRVKGTIEGIEAEGTGGFPCPNGLTKTAKLEIDATLNGLNEAGGATGVGLSHL